MTFSEILPFLNEGFAIRRTDYHPALIIFKQIPASIDNVKNLKSMPERVKRLLQKYKVGINYESQYIIYDFITGIGTYCVFDGEDFDATDWEIIKEDYNPYNY